MEQIVFGYLKRNVSDIYGHHETIKCKDIKNDGM